MYTFNTISFTSIWQDSGTDMISKTGILIPIIMWYLWGQAYISNNVPATISLITLTLILLIRLSKIIPIFSGHDWVLATYYYFIKLLWLQFASITVIFSLPYHGSCNACFGLAQYLSWFDGRLMSRRYWIQIPGWQPMQPFLSKLDNNCRHV